MNLILTLVNVTLAIMVSTVKRLMTATQPIPVRTMPLVKMGTTHTPVCVARDGMVQHVKM